jgi:putative transport protein
LVLQVLDVLHVAGPAENVHGFAQEMGNRTKALQQTDLLSLALGIVLGLLLGNIPIGLPGSEPFTLGMAGGPLLVALVLGHFGHVGKVAGHVPPATQLFLVRLGLALLLGVAAVNAGGKLTEVLGRYGGAILLITLLVNLTAVAAGLLAGVLCGHNLLQRLAVLCGGLSATPAYEALSAKADSDVVLVIFTTAYIMSMLLMVFAMEVFIAVFHAL